MILYHAKKLQFSAYNFKLIFHGKTSWCHTHRTGNFQSKRQLRMGERDPKVFGIAKQNNVTWCWKAVSSFVSEMVSFEICGWTKYLLEGCEKPACLSGWPAASLDAELPCLGRWSFSGRYEEEATGNEDEHLKAFCGRGKALSSYSSEFPMSLSWPSFITETHTISFSAPSRRSCEVTVC